MQTVPIPRFASRTALMRRGLTAYRCRCLQSPYGRGIYHDPAGPRALDVPDWIDEQGCEVLEMASALSVIAPDAVISHRSAGLLHGLPVRPTGRLEATLTGDASRIRRPWVSCTRTIHIEAVEFGHLRLASLRRTLIDLAAVAGYLELVQCFDAVLGSWNSPPECTLDMLTDHLRTTPHYAGKSLALQALTAARPGVDSPQETRLRLLLIEAGLPEPEIAWRVELPDGRHYRLDLAYPDTRIAIEYDGDHHRQEEGQYNRDIERHRRLQDLGWRVFRVTRQTDLRRLIADIRRCLGNRGA